MKSFDFKLSHILASALLLSIGSVALAEDQEQVQLQTRDQDRTMIESQDRLSDREQIYGSQLMTSKERAEYRSKMQNMKTQQEREAYRLEHHNLMQERARERGVQLPDSPPAQGMGQGQSVGPGGGGRRGR